MANKERNTIHYSYSTSGLRQYSKQRKTFTFWIYLHLRKRIKKQIYFMELFQFLAWRLYTVAGTL